MVQKTAFSLQSQSILREPRIPADIIHTVIIKKQV